MVFFIGQKTFQKAFSQKDFVRHSPKGFLQNLNWTAFNENRILFDKQAGKSIFVAFGAEWCLTCKLNERIFESQAFKNLVKEKNIVLYYGDWTVKNKEITDFLESYAQQGVPFYIFFKGEEKTFIFSSLLFQEAFLERLKLL